MSDNKIKENENEVKDNSLVDEITEILEDKEYLCLEKLQSIKEKMEGLMEGSTAQLEESLMSNIIENQSYTVELITGISEDVGLSGAINKVFKYG